MRLPFFPKKQLPISPVDNSGRRINRRELDEGGTKPAKPKVIKKPWGKKERLFVLGVLVATILIALVSVLSKSNSLPTFEGFEVPEVAVPSETFEFEK